MKQTTFASLAFESKKKLTRRERFLAEMDQVVPWAQLLKLIARHYPKAGKGRQPMRLETMLRIYFLQQWFNLSEPAVEDSLYDIESMRRFCGIELGDNAVPDETTILNFRRLLERHHLTEAIFKAVNKLLSDQCLLLKVRHPGRCHDHQCPVLDQKRRPGTRPRNDPDAERQPVVFRHEGAYRR